VIYNNLPLKNLNKKVIFIITALGRIKKRPIHLNKEEDEIEKLKSA
jgi:hypothetical protein